MDYNCVTGFIVGCVGAGVGISGTMIIMACAFWLVDKIFYDTNFGGWLCGKKNQ